MPNSPLDRMQTGVGFLQSRSTMENGFLEVNLYLIVMVVTVACGLGSLAFLRGTK